MGLTVEGYPKSCQENMRTILREVHADPQTAYAMMLMTASLMDLSPSDPKVAEMILDDCRSMGACKP